MIRTATRSMILAAAVSLAACKAARTPEPVATASPPAPTPTLVDPALSGPELREIPIEGDGRSVPLALAESDQGVVLFTTEPSGIGRYTLDLDANTAARTEVIPIDRYTNLAAYERAHDRLWWTAGLDMVRISQSSSGGFPRGDLVVTNASTVAHSEGLRETIRLCPTSTTVGGVGMLGGGGSLCDHEIRVLLPGFDGVLLGGHLAPSVGRASADAWLGFADASGALTAEHRLPGGDQAWIGALARSDAGVLAVAWSGRGEPARASFLLFDGPTLAPINTAARTTPTWTSGPWSAAVAAPDGSFWVVLTTTSYELTILSIARDGSIAAEHPIDGAELPISSVQWFGLRRGEPWLMIAAMYGDPNPTLWAGRIDPTSGAVPERYELPLPTKFVSERMLALDRGLLLAGRVNSERPLAVWIPLCPEQAPDELCK